MKKKCFIILIVIISLLVGCSSFSSISPAARISPLQVNVPVNQFQPGSHQADVKRYIEEGIIQSDNSGETTVVIPRTSEPSQRFTETSDGEDITGTTEFTSEIPRSDETVPSTTKSDAPNAQSTTCVASSSNSGSLTAHFIDVGQGDSILIQQGSFSMLVDAGEAYAGRTVRSYLQSLGITRLDIVVATHPHSDHIGGLEEIIKTFDIGRIIMPDAIHTTKTFENFLLAVRDKGLRISKAQAGDSYSLGNATVSILSPVGYTSDLDNASAIILVSHGSKKILLTGDAGHDAESKILGSGHNIKVDVLKVGHHGGKNATSESFLAKVQPKHAVISVGKNNSYGHPTQVVLDKLAAVGANIYRTDLSGTVAFRSDGNTLMANVKPNFVSAPTTTTPTQPATSPKTTTTAKVSDANKDEEKTSATVSSKTTAATTTILVAGGDYIGNKNSKKFHLPTCHTLPIEKNRVYFETREEAVATGYEPCKNCKP